MKAQTGLSPGALSAVKGSDSATVNIQAVADAAGVSKTTVSHVLSGKRPVSAATRRRVEKVMADLGYQPNFFAQALNRKKSNTLALIVQDLTNPFYPALARGLQSAVGGSDQVVLLFDAGAGDRLTHAFVQDAISRRVDGVVVALSDFAEDLAELSRAGVPVVSVGPQSDQVPMDWVTANDESIGFDAVMYLADAGHERIATIAGPVTKAPGAQRYAGYRRALTELGLPAPDELTVPADWTRDGGHRAMNELLQLTRRPTAVFCANDLMAIGAIDAIQQAGLRVPDDVAVVGVDDIDAAGFVRPALSTVRVPAEEIGRAAGELLMHRITAGETESHRHVHVQHTLISRDSA
jgi:LacI family transcriptional regulator